MGTKYSTVSISGYNSSPPSDDGSQTEANKVKWSTVKSKLNDPVKTAVESINTALVTALDQSAAAKTTAYACGAGDHDKTIEVTAAASSAVTVTLADAATMAAGYVVRVINRQTNYDVSVIRSGADTINGATSFAIPAGHSALFGVNAAANGYSVLGTGINSLGAWTATTPTPSATVGSFTSASCSARYKQVGKIVYYTGRVVISTNGTAAGFVIVPLPVQAFSGAYVGSMRESVLVGFTGASHIIPSLSVNDLYLARYDGTYPGASGYSLDFTIVYEAA